MTGYVIGILGFAALCVVFAVFVRSRSAGCGGACATCDESSCPLSEAIHDRT